MEKILSIGISKYQIWKTEPRASTYWPMVLITWKIENIQIGLHSFLAPFTVLVNLILRDIL